MAPVETRFDATPERTFEVLSQPRRYGFWVAGAREVHDHDPRWPQRGSEFRHTQGVWPLLITDTTSVVMCEPPRMLELEVRVRPLLVARVSLELIPDGDGTRVRMDERPIGGVLELPLKLPPWPQVLQARNKESLRRLRRLAEA
jgi:uncharacterized protein YndB with AHSA1/START domain